MTETGTQALERRQNLEEASAAVARAHSHERDLRFKRHILHLGSQIAPVRAPHVHAGVDEDDDQGLRGCADAVALRLLHSDLDVYRRYRPEGTEADLVFEILEQCRVEALAPESMPGMRANLRHRFFRWSDAYLSSGLLENDIGLLIFTIVHVCRSRIMNEPIEERINDYTEATRAGIYQDFGHYVRPLRGLIHDQEGFAACAAEIARNVGVYVPV